MQGLAVAEAPTGRGNRSLLVIGAVSYCAGNSMFLVLTKIRVRFTII